MGSEEARQLAEQLQDHLPERLLPVLDAMEERIVALTKERDAAVMDADQRLRDRWAAEADRDRLRGVITDTAWGLRHQPEISREAIAEMLEREAALSSPADRPQEQKDLGGTAPQSPIVGNE